MRLLAARIFMTLTALVMLVAFSVVVTTMNIITALWDSGELVADVGSRVLGNVWSRDEART